MCGLMQLRPLERSGSGILSLRPTGSKPSCNCLRKRPACLEVAMGHRRECLGRYSELDLLSEYDWRKTVNLCAICGLTLCIDPPWPRQQPSNCRNLRASAACLHHAVWLGVSDIERHSQVMCRAFKYTNILSLHRAVLITLHAGEQQYERVLVFSVHILQILYIAPRALGTVSLMPCAHDFSQGS